MSVTTDTGTARRQFRVLHREFLFRVVDRELVSSHAQGGDASKLLLQLASLLIFVGILFCVPAYDFGSVQPAQVRPNQTMHVERLAGDAHFSGKRRGG